MDALYARPLVLPPVGRSDDSVVLSPPALSEAWVVPHAPRPKI